MSHNQITTLRECQMAHLRIGQVMHPKRGFAEHVASAISKVKKTNGDRDRIQVQIQIWELHSKLGNKQ